MRLCYLATTLGVTIVTICDLLPTVQARMLEAEEQLAQLRRAHDELEARRAEGAGQLEAAGWRAEALEQERASPNPNPFPTPTPTPTLTCEP